MCKIALIIAYMYVHRYICTNIRMYVYTCIGGTVCENSQFTSTLHRWSPCFTVSALCARTASASTTL